MKYKIGDLVIIKETGEEVSIISVINSRIIEIEDDYGNERTILTKDVITPKQKQEIITTDKKEKKPEKQSVAANPKTHAVLNIPGFYLSFEPIFFALSTEIKTIKIHFKNTTKHTVLLEFYCQFQSRKTETIKQIVQPNQDLELENPELSELNGKPKFFYKINPTNTDWLKDEWFSISNHLSLTPKKLFEYISEIQERNQRAFNILLKEIKSKASNKEHSSSLNKSAKKAGISSKSKSKTGEKVRLKNIDKGSAEIDLHTDALGIKTQNQSNFEILSKQLNALEKAIDKAIELGLLSLVVIHGIGNGKLKEETQRLLRTHSQIKFIQHSWRPGYGMGATEAFFK